MNTQQTVPYLRSLSYCLDKVVEEGYKEDFRVTDNSMYSLQTGKKFTPDDVKVVNFFRFEGITDPADNAILYIIETANGAKGTIADAYGLYADTQLSQFMKEVEDIHKKGTAAANG
jgi:hypothetical protein